MTNENQFRDDLGEHYAGRQNAERGGTYDPADAGPSQHEIYEAEKAKLLAQHYDEVEADKAARLEMRLAEEARVVREGNRLAREARQEAKVDEAQREALVAAGRAGDQSLAAVQAAVGAIRVDASTVGGQQGAVEAYLQQLRSIPGAVQDNVDERSPNSGTILNL